MSVTLYGIHTCDTCRKATRALRAAGHEVTLRDVRALPLTEAERAEFVAAFGARIVNRASPSFRKLPEALKAAEPAAQLAAQPTVMKRPVIRDGARLHLGWSAEVQAQLL